MIRGYGVGEKPGESSGARVSSAGGFLGYLGPGAGGGWRRATAAAVAAVKAAVKPAVGVGNGVGFEVEAR